MIHRTARMVENVRLARPHLPHPPRLPGRWRPRSGRASSSCCGCRAPPTRCWAGRSPCTTPSSMRGTPVAIDVVYLVVGKMTGLLAGRAGRRAARGVGAARQRLPGPVGRRSTSPWSPAASGRRRSWPTPANCSAPAATAATRRGRRAKRVSLYYGVRTADLAAGVEDFRAAGAEVHLASDDGSSAQGLRDAAAGEAHGPPGPLVGCGPEPMLHALAKLAAGWGVPCQVSLETPMACGVGRLLQLRDEGEDGRRLGLQARAASTARSSTRRACSGSEVMRR